VNAVLRRCNRHEFGRVPRSPVVEKRWERGYPLQVSSSSKLLISTTMDPRAHQAFVPLASLPVLAKCCKNLLLPKTRGCQTKRSGRCLNSPSFASLGFPSPCLRARPLCIPFRDRFVVSLRCEFIGAAVRSRCTRSDIHIPQEVSICSSCFASPSGKSDDNPGTADNVSVKIEHTPSLQHEVAEASLRISDSGDGSKGPGRKGGDGGDGSSEGKGGGSENGRGGEPFAAGFSTLRNAFKQAMRLVKSYMNALGRSLNKVFDVVPAQVITAIIGILSGIAAQQSKSKADQRAAQLSKEEAMHRRREELERELRKKYTNFNGPLLSAAVKLSERIYFLVEGSDHALRSHRGHDHDPCPSSTYSAYLLGRYLGLVELIKRQSQTLDLGFPAADRIFMNILGRIQAVMCADDDSLRRMQESERYFKPTPGVEPFPGGPMQIMPRSQVAIGELMLRNRWSDSKLSSSLKHPSGILTLVEFVSLLESDSEMQLWFKPVIEDLQQLEQRTVTARVQDGRKRARSVMAMSPGERTRILVGCRPYFLQCALQDLVDFLVRKFYFFCDVFVSLAGEAGQLIS
jgi:hypothetical protein